MKTKPTENNAVHPQTVEIPQPLEVHPSVSSLAAELLMKTAELLAHEPACYLQSNPCGSVCCIIGHMEAIAGVDTLFGDSSTHVRIGLQGDQYEKIFHLPEWPAHIRQNYASENVPASIGIARIEHFLRTGE